MSKLTEWYSKFLRDLKRKGLHKAEMPPDIAGAQLAIHQRAQLEWWEEHKHTRGRKGRRSSPSVRHAVTDDGQIDNIKELLTMASKDTKKKGGEETEAKGKSAKESKKEEKPNTLGSKEVAELCGVKPATLRRFLRAKGKGAKDGDSYNRYEWEKDSPALAKVVKEFKAYQQEQEEAAEERKKAKKEKKDTGKKKASKKSKDDDESEEDTEELE